MPIAALPAYMGSDFKEASPGMRFGMYLAVWGKNRRTNELLWSLNDIDYEVRGQNRQEREVNCNNKVPALESAKKLNANDKATLKEFGTRQKQIFECSVAAGNGLQLEAIAISPFTTGLGNEHPLENGFSFLNPYGLPYLPGSGVKGVLRQAARELESGMWGEKQGWDDEQRYRIDLRNGKSITLSALDVLFGKESKDGETEHVRGALSFWDVIPQIKGDHLHVEIMTPHQSNYYQDGQSPHDSDQPTPISYMTVPPGSHFVFHVQCDTNFLGRVAPELVKDDNWKMLMQVAFEHAFNWCGFGAKTAVGYGVMAEDPQVKAEREKQEAETRNEIQRQAEEKKRLQELATMGPAERAMQELLDARTVKDQPELNALLAGLRNSMWSGELKIEIASRIKTMMQEAKKWREKSEKRRPEKDTDYQNTLMVMECLKGK